MAFELTGQIEKHLTGDQIVWLTTVTPTGRPAPRPVWFVWDGTVVTIYTLPIHFNKVLTGSHGGDAVPQVDIPRLIRLNKAGRLSLDGLITHEFPLDQINEALDVVRSGAAGRVLLQVA